MAITAGPLARSAVVFVGAGFRPVPAVGEDPAGVLLTWATLLGLGLSVVGAGLLGAALRRRPDPPVAATLLLLSAPAVPAAAIVLRLLSTLPLSVGRLLVGTNLALLPFGVAWIALGATVRSRSRPGGG